MASVNVYLNFNGNCEAAFTFYKEAFNSEFSYISKFADIPANEKFKVAEADKDKIMHVSLPIGETVLMGSDVGNDWTEKMIEGNNFSVSINTQSKAEADNLFAKLSAGGKVTMPMEKTFWGAYFGMFTDKFGIHWMVNFDE